METKKQEETKKKKILKKSLIGFFIAIIFVILIAIINQTGIYGKTIGFILYFLLIFFSIYEFSNIYNKILPKWSKIYFASLAFLSFFGDWNFLKEWLENTSTQANEFNILIQRQYQMYVDNIPGLGYAITVIYCVIPFIFSKRPFKTRIKFYLIGLFVFIFLIVIAKSLLLVSVDSVWFLLIIFVGPVVADTFAYFGGSMFGNKIFVKKLAPNISPNKTIEGALFGYLITWAVFFTITWFIKFDYINLDHIFMITFVPLLLPFVAIVGDLMFSKFKRMVNIKDYSNLIPGHGGIIDRIDSIVFTSFIFISLFMVI